MQTLFPKDKGRIYEEERVRFEIQEEYKRAQGKKMAIFMSSGCLLLALAVVGFFTMAYYISKSDKIPVGSEVTLQGGTSGAGVPIDLDAFEEYWHAIGAHNNHTIRRLILEGRLILVDNGTKATTLSDGSSFYRIRILQGRYAGQTGYIQETEIRYTKAK
jgi:hypothetical protein